MKNRLTTLGIFYLAFGVIGLIVAALFAKAIAGNLAMTGRLGMIATTAGFVSVIATIFSLESVPAIIGGVALLRRKYWARNLVLALGFVNLIIIPLGTALGIYTIWVLINEEVKEELNAGLM